jgi:hypothetical protein
MNVKTIRNIIASLAFILVFIIPVKAQSDSLRVIDPNRAIVYANDTIPVMHIPAVNIYDINKYSYLLHSWKYRRTIYNVKKAYPYAIVANLRLSHLDSTLAQIDSKKERTEYTKDAEKLIMQEFEDEVKRLTVRQGIILVKLIDRETGMTSYEVLKDIRGGFTAFFWQGIARLFGNNLKMQFDPEGEDKVIEDIVMAMEWGLL